MSAISHIWFIVAAYAVASIVIVGMIGAVVLDRVTLLRKIRNLEQTSGRESEAPRR